ncbi:RAD52 motif-containing protein 1 isoform X2 [Marmota flaviventris]|uniref:RAD52 motif-containing protein 1 isoform X2 n=1 Tax=Marmota flaviventris TaxID=93162 RepID=UPI003A8B4285
MSSEMEQKRDHPMSGTKPKEDLAASTVVLSGPLRSLMRNLEEETLAWRKRKVQPSQQPSSSYQESGKIAVVYRPSEEIRVARSEEELHDIIQVTCFSWKQYSQGEEEYLWDFSLEEEEFRLPELD